MFTVEIRVNGTLVTHIYGHNVSQAGCIGPNKYKAIVCKVGKRDNHSLAVQHNREDGIESLVLKILRKYCKELEIDESGKYCKELEDDESGN